jgi:hypothetical protein
MSAADRAARQAAAKEGDDVHAAFHALLRFAERRMASVHFSEFKRLVRDYGDARAREVSK